MAIKEFGYEYDASLDVSLWADTKGKVTTNLFWDALCLRSGRDALKVIAREYKPTVVLMPALACDSMVLPFKMYGHTVRYYSLTDEYRVDLPSLEKMIPKSETLFLYMDYFGRPAIDDDALLYLQSNYPQLVFVEDRTHTLLWKKLRKFIADYEMASLRKWLNIPDGGLLWSQKKLRLVHFANDTSFTKNRLKAQCMRREFFVTGDLALKAEYRRIFSSVSEIMDQDCVPSRMSAYSYELALQADWNHIRQKRQENAQVLISVLKQSSIDFIQPESGLSDLYVAFKVCNRNAKQAKLSSMGIFNTIIWPLNNEQKSVSIVAKDTEEKMLAAPCDQRYSVKDMEYIGQEMVRVFNE